MCASRTFAKIFLLDSCAPHSVSFWFVSYDTITKQRASLLFSIVHFLFFGPLLSFTPEYRRAYALTIKHIIMECEKRCFIIHFIHVCSRIFIHGTFSNSSFFCCILECMVYSFWLDTLNIRNKKDANKYKSENVWSARIVARAHSWEWKKKQNGERTGKLPPNYEEKRKLRKVKEIEEGWWRWCREREQGVGAGGKEVEIKTEHSSTSVHVLLCTALYCCVCAWLAGWFWRWFIWHGICNKNTNSFEISSMLTITKINGESLESRVLSAYFFSRESERERERERLPCGTSLFYVLNNNNISTLRTKHSK